MPDSPKLFQNIALPCNITVAHLRVCKLVFLFQLTSQEWKREEKKMKKKKNDKDQSAVLGAAVTSDLMRNSGMRGGTTQLVCDIMGAQGCPKLICGDEGNPT